MCFHLLPRPQLMELARQHKKLQAGLHHAPSLVHELGRSGRQKSLVGIERRTGVDEHAMEANKRLYP